MKHPIRLLLLALLLSSFSGMLHAQNGRQRLTREQLAETQAQFIAREIAMDDATAQRFTETYCNYQKEVWALGARPARRGKNLTDEETEQALKERFDRSQKLLNLRQKYYALYSRFLTPKQIQRVYELERQMMNRLRKNKPVRRRHASQPSPRKQVPPAAGVS